MKNDCLFCKMLDGEIPVIPVYQNETAIVIRDISPKAPVHLLVIPRRHGKDMVEWSSCGKPGEWASIMDLVIESAIGEQVTGGGFRTVINTGDDGGQTVGHLHLHLLGGRAFSWPPG